MDDTLIYIFIDVKYDYNFCRSNYCLKSLDTYSFEPTNQNSAKVPNVSSQQIR